MIDWSDALQERNARHMEGVDKSLHDACHVGRQLSTPCIVCYVVAEVGKGRW